MPEEIKCDDYMVQIGAYDVHGFVFFLNSMGIVKIRGGGFNMAVAMDIRVRAMSIGKSFGLFVCERGRIYHVGEKNVIEKCEMETINMWATRLIICNNGKECLFNTVSVTDYDGFGITTENTLMRWGKTFTNDNALAPRVVDENVKMIVCESAIYETDQLNVLESFSYLVGKTIKSIMV